MRYPEAISRPSDKHGYRGDDAILGLGIVGHSMEGSLAAAFGELDRADRQASWPFSVAKDGRVYQHINTLQISYASGSYEANKRFWSIEHEGVASEPLTGPQLAATIALMGWLLSKHNLKPVRKETLWEHREMTAYGASPTACPSGRIPWPVIITELQEPIAKEDWLSALSDDQQRELYNWVYAIRTVLYDSVIIQGVAVPRWAYWQTLMQQGAAPDAVAVANAKEIADELAARLKE